MKPSLEREQRLYDALKRITSYYTLDQIRSRAQKEYGLDYEEALEYSYENMKDDAKFAIKGMRRPTLGAQPSSAKSGPNEKDAASEPTRPLEEK